MNAKCSLLEIGVISQELGAALRHGEALVSAALHLGSSAFNSFVSFHGQGRLLMAAATEQSGVVADGCDSNADCSC